MAKRKSIKTKRKPVRRTRAEIKSIDEMHYGPMPTADYFEKHNWHNFFQWYSYMFDRVKINTVITSYAKKHGYKNSIKFKKMYLPGTLAALISGLENEVKFPDVDTSNKPLPKGTTGNAYVQAHIHEQLREWNKKAHKLYNQYMGQDLLDKDKVVKKRKTVQENIKAKGLSLLAEVDYAIDVWDVEPFDMYKYLSEQKVSSAVANSVVNEYDELIAEIKEAREGDCEQLKEGYAHLSKSEMNDFLNFVIKIKTDIERYTVNHKPVRKPRKAKQISAIDQVKKLNYLKEDIDNKITSIEPSKIIGAQMFFAYNTKTNQLAYYHAQDRGGLKVTGTTIKNYDLEKSQVKKLGAKTTDVLDRVLSGGKIVLNKIMSEINSKSSKATGRINNNMILLKVD